MYFLKVDDVALPTPTYYRVGTADIDSSDSSRSDETGVMHRKRVRAGVKTCEVKWTLNGSQADALHVSLAEPVLSVSLLDPAACGYYSCEMYAKELKSVFYQQQNGSTSGSYWEISCRLVEY